MSFFIKMTDLDRLATSGEFQETGELLQLDHPSRIFLDLQQDSIHGFRRENNDLIVEANDGSQLRIADFYHETGDSQLYLKGDDGGLMLVVLSPVDESGSLFSQYVALTEASPFESVDGSSHGVFSDSNSSGDGWLADNWGLVALGVLGIGGAGAAVAGLGDGGGSSNSAPARPAIPAAPSIEGNVGGAFPAGDVTVVDDTLPTFSGSGAVAGNTITLYEGTAVIGTAVVAADGSWSLEPNSALPEGVYSFTLTATDSAGRESAHSAAINVTVKSGVLDGGNGDDLLIGGAGDNVLNGGDGNDTLVDGSGIDTFNGGAGNDEVIIRGGDFALIDGGLDIDTLTLDNGISLNTSTMTGTIRNIERVDLAKDANPNTLTLTSDAVEAMTDANNELQIVGNNNDTLNANGAVLHGQETINAVTYDQYTFGATTLLVDHDIVVNVN